jgi:hypothetical protein
MSKNHVILAQQDERQVLSAESVRRTSEHHHGFGTRSSALGGPLIRELSGLLMKWRAIYQQQSPDRSFAQQACSAKARQILELKLTVATAYHKRRCC